jgi:hypothetical protein
LENIKVFVVRPIQLIPVVLFSSTVTRATKTMEQQRRQQERKRLQKIRKRANKSFLDFHGLDRNDPNFLVK